MQGCQVRNAESVHPEWEVKVGDPLVLHPKMPPLEIVRAEPGAWFVAYGRPDESARAAGRPWVGASWLFFLEPLGEKRCRFVSRYRVTYSNDLVTRLSLGPVFIEPIGFAMDRRMLLGVKSRAEGAGRRSMRASSRPRAVAGEARQVR